MDGRGGKELVCEPWGTMIKSERQTPRPGTTVELSTQLAGVHEPERRTELVLAQPRQLLGPVPEQLEQLESQD